MDLKEIVKYSGFTQKALCYYNKDAIKMFQEYLKDIEESTPELERFDEALEKCKKIIYSDHANIKIAAENMNILTKIYNMHERKKDGCIKKELCRIFPGFFGKYIYLIFSDYFMEAVDTRKKQASWENIVSIFDEIEYPDESEKIEKFIQENSINWTVVEKFIQCSKRRIGSRNNASIYDYPNILNYFQVTEKDVDFCDKLFGYMNSENQIGYMKNLVSLIDSDLSVLSEKYRNTKNDVYNAGGFKDPDTIEKGSGIINFPEMTFAVFEYRKFLPFGNMDSLVCRFKLRIDEIDDVISPENIYLIKGIDAISKYRKSKMNIFEFGFSFLVGARIAGTGKHTPEDMKVITIPAHKYAWYTSSGSSNVKDLILEDLSTVNFIDNKYKLSNFPTMQLYNEKKLGKKSDRLVFNNYIPIE